MIYAILLLSLAFLLALWGYRTHWKQSRLMANGTKTVLFPGTKDEINRYTNSSGQLHRLDGPAIEGAKVRKYYLNGKLHRTNGPAVSLDSYTAWYHNDQLSRQDGPARVWSDGLEEWLLQGKRHRYDGPAVYGNGIEEYWFDGERITEEQAKQYAAAYLKSR